MDYVTRIHLKMGKNRRKLIDFCLFNNKQYLAIGWSKVYSNNTQFNDFNEYKKAIKSCSKRLNPAVNVFDNAKEGDLFWTRDCDGFYWICRVEGSVLLHCDTELDIGALLPVEAYMYGTQVPGRIRSSFNRKNGGTVETIYEKSIVEFSKYIFNRLSEKNIYSYEIINGRLVENLPEFDLEELVICYLQIEKDYFVLSNSIANKSQTPLIECEFINRNNNAAKAVVQVKGEKGVIDASDYYEYVKNGYTVYLYAPVVDNIDNIYSFVRITEREISDFYYKYKNYLPKSITMWENIFNIKVDRK